jgi:hypothetical protein
MQAERLARRLRRAADPDGGACPTPVTIWTPPPATCARLLHAHQAEPATVLPDGLEIESPAVVVTVISIARQIVTATSNRFASPCSTVSERLLSNWKKQTAVSGCRCQGRRVERDLDVVPLPDLGAVRLQGRRGRVSQGCGMQIVRQTPDSLERPERVALEF